MADHACREPREVALALALDELDQALGDDGRIRLAHDVLGVDAGGVRQAVPGTGLDGIDRRASVEVIQGSARQVLSEIRVHDYLRSFIGTNVWSSGPV